MCTPYIESEKWLPWQHPLEPQNRLCLHRRVWPRKPTPRIKLHVASYHTTKVIAHQTSNAKASYSKSCPKIGCHGNVSQHLSSPIQHMIPTAHPSPQPKRHQYRFRRLCTDDHRVSLYFTMGRPFSPKNLPLPVEDLDPHLIHGSLGPPKSSTQTAVRSVQPFLQGSLVWQTDRPTDHATRSVRTGLIYVRSTGMWPNNTHNTYKN